MPAVRRMRPSAGNARPHGLGLATTAAPAVAATETAATAAMNVRCVAVAQTHCRRRVTHGIASAWSSPRTEVNVLIAGERSRQIMRHRRIRKRERSGLRELRISQFPLAPND